MWKCSLAKKIPNGGRLRKKKNRREMERKGEKEKENKEMEFILRSFSLLCGMDEFIPRLWFKI